jgi:hypothetical protein
MAAGEITPDEAVTVTRMLDGRLEALNAFKLQRELTRYRGDFIRGDELFRPAEEQFREPGVVAAEEEVEEETAEKETEAATLTEPSPPGRGQGEGGCRASVVEDERVVGDPHPNPLPEGEGMAAAQTEAATQTEPSPPGRGQGEGGCRASVVEDERVVGDPHPSPLPEGEGIAASETGTIPSVPESPDAHLHSACIELDVQAESAARQAAQRKLAQWGYLIRTQPGFSEEAFIAAEIQRSAALKRSSASLPGHNSRSPSSLNGVATVLR